jgi:hypothetical protein
MSRFRLVPRLVFRMERGVLGLQKAISALVALHSRDSHVYRGVGQSGILSVHHNVTIFRFDGHPVLRVKSVFGSTVLSTNFSYFAMVQGNYNDRFHLLTLILHRWQCT